MGRAPCCSKVGLHKGPWTAREDTLLTKYIHENGEGQWRSLPKKAGLLRCGKSCRLRWMNYLRPDVKRGNIGPDEEDLIIRLHKLLGNRWSLIAGRLPGRTDNEIKNYWNTHLSKRLNNNHRPPKAGHSQKKGNKNKSEKKKNERKDNVERMKTKIHLPKPIRLKSFPRNFHAMETNNSSGGVGKMDLGLLDDPVDRDVGLSAQSHVSNEDGMLEKLYEEYLDLLKQEEQGKLESLAESFWV